MLPILCWTLALLAPPALADAHLLRFKHLRVEDGLSQGAVNAIAQDRHGFIWLGTQQGLNRYDGVEFRTYFSDPLDPFALPADWIRSLHLHSKGSLWVATNGGGLARFDELDQTFIRFPLEGKDIRAIEEDAAGRLWLAAGQDGVYQIDTVTLAATHYPAATVHPSGSEIKAVHYDPYGHLWLGSKDGLSRYDPMADSFVAIPGIEGEVRAITGGGDQPLWIGVYDRGLYEFDWQTGATRLLTDVDGLSSPKIRALHIGADEALWIGHEVSGLNRLDPDGTSRSIVADPSRMSSLVGDHVQSIFEDRSGVVWIGTETGLSLWNPRSTRFSVFARTSVPGRSLSQDWIAGFAEESPSRFWVATHGGGINRVDVRSGAVEVFAHDPADRNTVAEDSVMALHLDDADLWAGTLNRGLSRLDVDTGTWRHYEKGEAADTLSSNVITGFLKDRAGTLWISTFGGGINRYLPESDSFERVTLAERCSDRALDMHSDRNGFLWVATKGGGLCRFDPESGGLDAFLHDPLRADSISSDETWLVTEDAQGNLLVGTVNSGLNIWTAADRAAGIVRFQRLLARDGLASNVVYGIEFDALGRLWIGSNRGLTRYELDYTTPQVGLKSVRHFTSEDGLQGNEFNFAASLHASNGKLLFGGTGGFTIFQPGEDHAQLNPLELRLTGFYKINQPTRFRIDAPAFSVDYSDKIVRFEYAALSFTSPREVRYQHILDGFDAQWNDSGNLSRATYTNLAPGNYTFRVRARNENGEGGVGELSVPLRVAAPFWATPAAYVSYAVCVLLVLFIAYLSWSRRLAVAREIEAMNVALIAEAREREAKEIALERQRAQSQQYLDIVEVVLLALDPDGRVSMVNNKGLRLLGCGEDDVVGRDFVGSFVPAAEREEVSKTLAQLGDYAYTEFTLQSATGEERLVAWHGISIPDDAPGSRGILISGTDVTQMRNLERQLRDSQKMEALGTLARGVAHDFNNALSAILGYAELARAELEARSDAQQAETYIDNLEGSVARAKDIVGNILAFGRASDVPTRVIDAAEVVGDALQLVRPIVPANVRITEIIQSNCGRLLANPAQLIQIVLNLATNACQAMSEAGGTLTIELSAAEVDMGLARERGALTPGAHVKLTVADTGHGMDDYTISRMFEPFFTTRPTGEGTGLGLSVVHAVVSGLGGTVDVDSDETGTRFTVWLPACDDLVDEAYEEAEPLASGLHARSAGRTVLFVDDEPALVQIAEIALERAGYTVLTADNGTEAMRLLAQDELTIDLLITDGTMPDLHGEVLAQEAKRLRPGLPVLLISGADQARSGSVDGFLSKPFSREILTHRAAELIDGADRSAKKAIKLHK